MKREVDPKLSEAVNKVNELFVKNYGKYKILCQLKADELMIGVLQQKKYSDHNERNVTMKYYALKSLYGIYRIPKEDVDKWIKRLVKFLNNKKEKKEEPNIDWVDEISESRFRPNRNQPSFLSKFFHFFVKGGKNKIPVFDSFACDAVSKIIKNSKGLKEKFKKYKERAAKIKKVGDYKLHAIRVLTIQKELNQRENIGLRALDRFLWVAGHYCDNKELSRYWKKMFEDNDFKEIAECLNRLFKKPV